MIYFRLLICTLLCYSASEARRTDNTARCMKTGCTVSKLNAELNSMRGADDLVKVLSWNVEGIHPDTICRYLEQMELEVRSFLILFHFLLVNWNITSLIRLTVICIRKTPCVKIEITLTVLRPLKIGPWILWLIEISPWNSLNLLQNRRLRFDWNNYMGKFNMTSKGTWTWCTVLQSHTWNVPKYIYPLSPESHPNDIP